MQSITITLPDDVQIALDKYLQKEGGEANEIIGNAVRNHLFLKQIRSLRERLSSQAQSQGIVTDQDVFDRVSCGQTAGY